MQGKKNKFKQFCLRVFLIVGGIFLAVSASAQSGLQVTYGPNGVQTLAYSGLILEDLGAYPSDAFHIWHMKSTDLAGNPNYAGQYGWGENHNNRQWNASSNTMTYSFVWGTIQTRFAQTGDNLDMIVTETNNAGSGIIFDGAEIYPVTLHFPQDPKSFSGYTQYAITTTGPGVSEADYGAGVVTSVIPNESVALYGGWKIAGAQSYTPIMSGTSPDGLALFLPHNDAPVPPGSSFTYTVSLRFTPEGTAANASDAYTSFAATYPSQMTWTDKRIIGTSYLASSPSGADITQPGGFPTNPRRYFNDPLVDLTTANGRLAFQSRVLLQATTNVSTIQAMGGQGVITWDIEGEQYPQDTSYVCSPDQIATVAPEMETLVKNTSSPYFGMRLDDAYFKTMTDAGLKVGLCLRPQVFTLGANGTASQIFLTTNAAIIANLENKAKYANSRWAATIFYVDSTVDTNGGVLDPAIFQQLITDMPGFLFIPEESTPRYYAYSAPFYSFIFHTDLGTPASTYKFYPKAFGANLVNDVSAATLAQYTPQLTQSVANGDILMGHADYLQANDPTLVAIYKAAGAGTTAPVPVSPSITWNAPASIPYGTPLSPAQLNATANVPGSFIYTPAAGTVVGAGTTTLLATFTPSDTTHYTAAAITANLTVTQAAPLLTWAAPAPIVQGTPLTQTQLNASANVPGSFSYTPSAGTVLAVGTAVLIVTFTPSDTADYTSATASANLIVTTAAQKTPVITWTTPAAITYGTALSAAQLNATANVPGSFNYTPPAGTVLNAGNPTLVAIFTPSDTTNYVTATASTSLVVNRATPVISWSVPAPILYGTPLTPLQLNATANISGNFTYTPSAGSVLNAGNQTLTATFTPSDATDYLQTSVSTALTVTRATPVVSWAAPAPISYGTPLTPLQLNATANISGNFNYTPSAGSVLNAGNQTLTATFTPSDATDYLQTSVSTTLTVTRATPVISWVTPPPISYGTALSSSQLNASANVPGAFSYTPSANTVLNAGTTLLQATFTPSDTTDYATAAASVLLNVGQVPATPVTLGVLYPLAGQTISGSIYVTAQIKLNLDSAGSFLIVDGVYQNWYRASQAPYVYPLDTTTLSNGPHTLQIWAHDIGNNVTISSPVQVVVSN